MHAGTRSFTAMLLLSVRAIAAPAQTPLHVFEGAAPQQWLAVTRNVEDLNGDGVDDLALGAPGNLDTPWVMGHVRVVSGADWSTLLFLSGSQVGDGFGLSIAPAGDIDGDGVDDILVGASLFDGLAGVDCGRVAAISGATGSELYSIEGEAAGDAFGAGLDGDGQLNTQVARDFIVSAPLHDGPNGVDSGRVYAYDGQYFGPGTVPSLIHSHDGVSAMDEFGDGLVFTGFVDLDDFTDYIVTAYAESTIGWGSARVYSGRTGNLIRVHHGVQPFSAFGSGVSGVGDVNADGRHDYLVGDEEYTELGVQAGSAFLYSGLDGTELHQFFGTGDGDLFGFPVADAGDLDGDGTNDILVGAMEA
ncbi:MAG: hypothetical protein ACI9F9_001901, partial [Candidatus Paceibacteria bacterium]